jgi:hypothetical protein
MFGSYYEQYYVKTLYFEPISIFEVMFPATVLCCLGFVPGLRVLADKTLFFHLNSMEIVLIVACLGAVVMFIRNIQRVGKRGNPLCLIYLPLAGMTAYFAGRLFSMPAAIAMTGFYCAAYSHRFLFAFVKGQKAPVPDFILPAVLLVSFVLPGPVRLVRDLGIVWALAQVITVWVMGFTAFRDGWVWKNPPVIAD